VGWGGPLGENGQILDSRLFQEQEITLKMMLAAVVCQGR
jgi:hypothetical protein